RSALAADYAQVQAMLDKLEHGHVHVAAFGRVSVGKSSLLNALLGEERFSVSPLHGETKTSSMQEWPTVDSGGVFLIDTPGINEIDGAEREELAREVAQRVDLVLFVVDSDLTDYELGALRELAATHRPVLLVLNKADRYSAADAAVLLETLAERCAGLVDRANIVAASASPAAQVVISVDEQGNETEFKREVDADVEALKARLWEILEAEGHTLAALNASLFAGALSDAVAERILETRRQLGASVLRTWCLIKGVAVAANPVPVADLLAAAAIDATLVWHLARIYDLPVTRAEAGTLVRVISTQLAALMGTVWAVNLVASALKAGTGGLSTIVTAGAQGAVAWYGTYVVGRVAERYLALGKSWGSDGPRQVVKDILASLDKDSIMSEARDEIQRFLRGRSLGTSD
ncbi:MAG: GTP-binding protein, partial [Pseudomonadota bacterium]